MLIQFLFSSNSSLFSCSMVSEASQMTEVEPASCVGVIGESSSSSSGTRPPLWRKPQQRHSVASPSTRPSRFAWRFVANAPPTPTPTQAETSCEEAAMNTRKSCVKPSPGRISAAETAPLPCTVVASSIVAETTVTKPRCFTFPFCNR